MERLHNGFTLKLCDGAFPLSTDSIALADFARLPKDARVLDLGAGCGTLGLLLCARDSRCQITGIELDAAAHRTALENAADNRIESRYESICADMRRLPSLLEAGSRDCCITNPPYFVGGPRSKACPNARQEAACTLEDVFSAAGWALRWGGDLYIVHRPERLAELCALGAKHRLEPKRLRLLRHQEGGSVTLVLLLCRKGARPGLHWEEVCLYRADGQPSAYYKKLYHQED